MREAAYGALIALLEGEPDLAVRLVTLGALHALCDDWSFEEETFAPHLSRALNACFALCGASVRLWTSLRTTQPSGSSEVPTQYQQQARRCAR